MSSPPVLYEESIKKILKFIKRAQKALILRSAFLSGFSFFFFLFFMGEFIEREIEGASVSRGAVRVCTFT